MSCIDTSVLNKFDPYRSPSWRWELARDLVSSPAGLRNLRVDRHVLQAVRFRKAVSHCEQLDSQPMRSMEAAYKTWKQDAPVRWVLEARLLSGESLSEIGERCGFTAQLVFSYEKIFYNVLDRLDAPDYVVTRLLGPAWIEGPDVENHEVIWKAFGYFGGPHVLDYLIAGFSRENGTGQPGETSSFLAKMARGCLLAKIGMVARQLPISGRNTLKKLRTLTRLLEDIANYPKRSIDHVSVSRNLHVPLEPISNT